MIFSNLNKTQCNKKVTVQSINEKGYSLEFDNVAHFDKLTRLLGLPAFPGIAGVDSGKEEVCIENINFSTIEKTKKWFFNENPGYRCVIPSSAHLQHITAMLVGDINFHHVPIYAASPASGRLEKYILFERKRAITKLNPDTLPAALERQRARAQKEVEHIYGMKINSNACREREIYILRKLLLIKGSKYDAFVCDDTSNPLLGDVTPILIHNTKLILRCMLQENKYYMADFNAREKARQDLAANLVSQTGASLCSLNKVALFYYARAILDDLRGGYGIIKNPTCEKDYLNLYKQKIDYYNIVLQEKKRINSIISYKSKSKSNGIKQRDEAQLKESFHLKPNLRLQ